MTRPSQNITAQERVKRKPGTAITISFERFMCLRSIADAVRVDDRARYKALIKDLHRIELKDYSDTLKGEEPSVSYSDYMRDDNCGV